MRGKLLHCGNDEQCRSIFRLLVVFTVYTILGMKTSSDGKVVTLKLNQQQLELLDRTLAQGVANDRASLVRLALREFAAKHGEAKSGAVPERSKS